MGNTDRGNTQIEGAHADTLVTLLKIEDVCRSADPQSSAHNLSDNHNWHGLFTGQNGDSADNEWGIAQEDSLQRVGVEGDYAPDLASRMWWASVQIVRRVGSV